MNITQKHYRQGDVQLRYVDSLPSKLKAVVRQSGRLVLATGSGGHAHYIADPDTEMGADADGTRFLTVKGETMKGRWPIIKHTKLHVLVRHPKFGEIAFAESDIKVSGKSAVVDGHFALLIHDSKPVEHYPQALPRGQAELMEQSEYNQEEIRRVTD
jgi:hypothetical protein